MNYKRDKQELENMIYGLSRQFRNEGLQEIFTKKELNVKLLI